MIRFCFSFLISIFILLPLQAQEYNAFEGKLTYTVNLISNLDSIERFQFNTSIYTNDTLVRVESFSPQVGAQVLIKHLQLQKYYLLLELNGKKYAIQQHIDSEKEENKKSKYTFRKKRGKKKIAGQKAKRVFVVNENFPRELEMWYLPTISPKYLDALPGISGLPVDYYIASEEGLYHYVLDKIEFEAVNKAVFGIPSDFKKVSFEEFMNEMMPTE